MTPYVVSFYLYGQQCNLSTKDNYKGLCTIIYMKFKIILSIATSYILLISSLTTAKAAYSWADCVIITGGKIDQSFSYVSPSYDFTVSNGCSGSDIGSIKIEFKNGDILSYSYRDTETIYSFLPYQYFGKKMSFSLKDIKPGLYFPSVKITALKDYSSKTISLPFYNINVVNQSTNSTSVGNSWVDCVIINDGKVNKSYTSLPPSYDFTVSDGCVGSDTGSVKIEFKNGDILSYSYLDTETIYSFSSYQYYDKKMSFSLKDIKPGLYFPSVRITALNDYSSKTISLPSYTIEAPKQPILTAADSNSAVYYSCAHNSTLKIQECDLYPNWSISVCVSNDYINAILQQQNKTSWSDLFKVSTIYDSTSCSSTINPYLLVINGSSKLSVNKSVNLRVVNAKKNITILTFKVTTIRV